MFICLGLSVMLSSEARVRQIGQFEFFVGWQVFEYLLKVAFNVC